jgi:heptosyltransferase-2
MNNRPHTVTIHRLLVRTPNWVGDAVLSLGALRDLRRHNFPGARLTVLAKPWVAPIYEAVAEVDAVIASVGVRADAKALRGGFDAAVLLPNSFAAAATVFLARIPERWGYATDGRGALLTRRARLSAALRGAGEVYYYRAMLAGVGLEVSASPDCSLQCPEAWSRQGAALLGTEAEGGWIGLNPGAFFGSAKRWIPARYAAAGDRLARESGGRVAIIGGAAERPLAEAIASAMQTPARVLTGSTTLADLVGVLAQLRLLVTNDSGPMHLAAALGVPVAAVFGPTDWRETAPRGESARVVREPVECAPCKLRECPIDHRCMRGVTVARVADEALALMQGRRG